MTKEKIKGFWKDHKKEIIGGAIIACAGAIFGGFIATRKHGETRDLIDILNDFNPVEKTGNTIVMGILRSMNGSNYAEVHRFNGEMTVRELGDFILEYYAENGIDNQTPVKGMVLFEKR